MAFRLRLLSAVFFRSCDWEWFDRGSMQKLGGQAAQADGCVLAEGAGEPNGDPCRSTLLRPVEARMEYVHMIFYTPHFNCRQRTPSCKKDKIA